MKKFALLKSKKKPEAESVYDILCKIILAEGGEYVDVEYHAQAYDEDSLKAALGENTDCIICIGGDGTFLQSVRYAYPLDIPVLGVNTGRLGFLTDIELDDINFAIKRLINDDYEIEERMMLEVDLNSAEHGNFKNFAFNDVVVKGQSLSRIVNLSLYIDDEFIDFVPGDGIVVSTPTGSTAYSMAAGGPIVEPDMDAMVITPICPHLLYSRTFVTGGAKEIRVSVDEDNRNEPLVTVDGKEGYSVGCNDYVVIRKAERSMRIIKLNDKNFYSVLRDKMFKRK